MPSYRHRLPLPRTRPAAALAVSLAVCLAARAGEPAPAAKPAAADAAVEVTLGDGSTLKVTLRDERVEVETRYGKLLIPAAELRRVEFRTRIPAGDARRAEAAVAGLGSREFREREAAGAELLRLGPRAYPALLKAAGDGDAEVARRAKEVLEKLREAVPAERLEVRDDDRVWAGGCEIVGRIAGDSFRVETLPFGEQRLRLADARSLRSPSYAPEDLADAAPDPGNLAAFANETGKTFTFKVTGRAGAAAGVMPAAPVIRRPAGGVLVWPAGGAFGVGALWGTDVYTSDSTLALAAVHAGVLKAGQTGVVKVKILGAHAGFQGSTRNGVTSMDFGPYLGYTVSK